MGAQYLVELRSLWCVTVKVSRETSAAVLEYVLHQEHYLTPCSSVCPCTDSTSHISHIFPLFGHVIKNTYGMGVCIGVGVFGCIAAEMRKYTLLFP